MMFDVVPGEEGVAVARASWIEPNRAGKAGRYFNVLNCASENGFHWRRAGGHGLGDAEVGQSSATGFEVIAGHGRRGSSGDRGRSLAGRMSRG